MAGSLYVATNTLDGATVTAPGGTATGYAIANVYNYRPSKGWKSSVTTANQRINVDLGSAQTTNFAGLMGHSFPSGSTVTVEGYSTAPPTSGAWASAATLGTFTIRTSDMWVALTTTSYRYRSFYLQNDGGADWSSGGAPSVGEAVLGTSVQITRQHVWGAGISAAQNNITHVTPYGVPWMSHASDFVSFDVSYEDLSNSERNEIILWHAATAGAAKPFAWVPYPDSADSTTAAQVHYMRVSDVLPWRDGLNHSGFDLTLTELPTGIVLT